MKAKELRELTKDELKQKLGTVSKELFDLTYRAQMGSIEKPSRIKQARRDVARIKTLIQEKDEDQQEQKA